MSLLLVRKEQEFRPAKAAVFAFSLVSIIIVPAATQEVTAPVGTNRKTPAEEESR